MDPDVVRGTATKTGARRSHHLQACPLDFFPQVNDNEAASMQAASGCRENPVTKSEVYKSAERL
jgi:hypothetical protein